MDLDGNAEVVNDCSFQLLCCPAEDHHPIAFVTVPNSIVSGLFKIVPNLGAFELELAISDFSSHRRRVEIAWLIR